MIGAELSLKSIDSVAKGSGHDSSVCDNHVERFPFRQQPIGADAHALKAGQIELDQFETAAASDGVLAHLSAGLFRLDQIASRAYNLVTVERPMSVPSQLQCQPRRQLQGSVCPADRSWTKPLLWLMSLQIC